MVCTTTDSSHKWSTAICIPKKRGNVDARVSNVSLGILSTSLSNVCMKFKMKVLTPIKGCLLEVVQSTVILLRSIKCPNNSWCNCIPPIPETDCQENNHDCKHTCSKLKQWKIYLYSCVKKGCETWSVKVHETSPNVSMGKSRELLHALNT